MVCCGTGDLARTSQMLPEKVTPSVPSRETLSANSREGGLFSPVKAGFWVKHRIYPSINMGVVQVWVEKPIPYQLAVEKDPCSVLCRGSDTHTLCAACRIESSNFGLRRYSEEEPLYDLKGYIHGLLLCCKRTSSLLASSCIECGGKSKYPDQTHANRERERYIPRARQLCILCCNK